MPYSNGKQYLIVYLNFSIMLKSCIRNPRIFGIPCLRRFLNSKRQTIPNFWSPKQFRGRFRIYDPPKNTRKGSEFLIPYKNTGEDSECMILQRTQERTLNFWAPKQPGRKKFISGLKAVANLRLKSIKYSRVKRGHHINTIQSPVLHPRQGLNVTNERFSFH